MNAGNSELSELSESLSKNDLNYLNHCPRIISFIFSHRDFTLFHNFDVDGPDECLMHKVSLATSVSKHGCEQRVASTL